MARGASGPRFAGGRLAPGLRIATHNVRGIAGRSISSLQKSHQLFKIWCQLRLHIVCAQEINIKAEDTNRQRNVQQALDAAATRHGHPGFNIHWGCSTSSRGGVAILIRRDLPLALAGSVHTPVDGRLIHVRCQWAGHDFRLINCYLPSGDPTGQRDFLNSHLQPLLQIDDLPVVMSGDWNFTPDWRRDRLWSAEGASHHRDEAPAAAFASLPRLLIDAYRHLHPQRRSFTWHGHAGDAGSTASRLDRIYVSPELASRAFQCTASQLTVSDHRPVLLHLLPIHPVDRGRGLRRTRMDFWKKEHLQQEWLGWLSDRARFAPDDPQTLVAWWLSFKVEMSHFTAGLNQACRAQQHPSEEEKSARRDLEEATTAAETARSPDSHHIDRILEARRRFVLASAAEASQHELQRRFSWIRAGESPSPVLTRLLRPPKASHQIAALRCLGGGLVIDGRHMASIMAEAFTAVSVDPPADPTALEEVVLAIRKHAPPLPHSVAVAVVSETVTVEEVAAAARLTLLGS